MLKTALLPMWRTGSARMPGPFKGPLLVSGQKQIPARRYSREFRTQQSVPKRKVRSEKLELPSIGRVYLHFSEDNGSYLLFPPITKKSLELTVGPTKVRNQQKSSLAENNSPSVLNITLLNLFKHPEHHDEIYRQFMQKLNIGDQSKIQTADVHHWQCRIATENDFDIFTAPITLGDTLEQTVKVSLDINASNALRGYSPREVFCFIEGLRSIQPSEETFKDLVDSISKGAETALLKLAKTAVGDPSYLIPLKDGKNDTGSINAFLLSAFKNELLRNPERFSWPTEVLQPLFNLLAKQATNFDIQKEEKNKIVNFMSDDRIKISTALSKLQSLDQCFQASKDEEILVSLEEAKVVAPNARVWTSCFRDQEISSLGRNKSILCSIIKGTQSAVTALKVERCLDILRDGSLYKQLGNLKQITLRAPSIAFSLVTGGGTQLQTQLQTMTVDPSVPVGSIIAYAGDYLPPLDPLGWLPCDGSALDGTQEIYFTLIDVIGTRYNPEGVLAPTFHLPDYRGMFLRGANRNRDPLVGDPEINRPLARDPQTDTLRKHYHSSEEQKIFWSTPMADSQFQGGLETDGEFTDGGTRGISRLPLPPNGADETRPKNMAVHYLIKYTNAVSS